MNSTYSLPGIGANYSAALNQCIYQNGGTAAYADLGDTNCGFSSGLTIGHTYEFQIWYNDLRSTTRTMTWDTGTSTPSVVLSSGNSPTLISTYAIATFTADSTIQTFRITSSFGPVVNMMQLRDITPVPEPTTYGLIGAGSLVLAAGIR